MAPSVQVFGLPASTEVARVLACLFEKNVDFQLVRVDSYKNDHKVPEFLKFQNPCGQVTMKDGERIFTDSRKICRHICKEYADQGNKGLLGAGALERSLVELWLLAEKQKFDPPSSALIFQLGFAIPMKEEPDKNLIDENCRKLDKVLGIYDERLSESNFLAGDEFTLVDLSHLPNSHYLTKTEIGHNLFSKRKNLTRWWNEIKECMSWKYVMQLQDEHPGPLDKFNDFNQLQKNQINKS